jgi:transcriptional regulator with XRE-family HTH domain
MVRSVGLEIARLREDVGVPGSVLARTAGISPAHLNRVESGRTTASLPTLLAISDALGSDLAVRFYPNTGPRIRDRHQAPILEALLRGLDPRWRSTPEVPVRAPVRGVIDAVLHDPTEPIVVATEIHSEVRRLEQLLRWHAEKAAALTSSELWPFLSSDAQPALSRLLVLRSTRANRLLVATFEGTLRAAYPASITATLEALTGRGRWPGPALLWASVGGGTASILRRPPRGVGLGL